MGPSNSLTKTTGGTLRNSIIGTAVSLLALATGAHAEATSTSSASLANVHISFADADPTDALTPTYSLFGIYGATQVYNAQQYQDDIGFVSTSTTVDAGNYGVVDAAGDTVEGASLHSHSTATSTPPGDFQTSTAIASGQFTLDPGGKLTLTADANLAITDATGVGGTQADAYVQWQYWSVENQRWVVVNDVLFADVYDGLDVSGTLTATIVNTTDAPLTGYFNNGIQATSQFLSAVPEPAETWLLLAGLALTGMAACRRRDRGPRTTAVRGYHRYFSKSWMGASPRLV
jgi:hypothetical protein